jgi:hypothetical protein
MLAYGLPNIVIIDKNLKYPYFVISKMPDKRNRRNTDLP